jgi:hypothetical protein
VERRNPPFPWLYLHGKLRFELQVYKFTSVAPALTNRAEFLQSSLLHSYSIKRRPVSSAPRLTSCSSRLTRPAAPPPLPGRRLLSTAATSEFLTRTYFDRTLNTIKGCAVLTHVVFPPPTHHSIKGRVARFFLVQHTKMWNNIPNNHKYTRWPQTIPNCRKVVVIAVHIIYQHPPLQDSPKFTQIGIFGLKICHLSTLIQRI